MANTKIEQASFEQAIHQVLDGDQSDKTSYDDIQGAIISGRKTGFGTVVSDYNVGGANFTLSTMSIDDFVEVTFQTPHAMKLNTVLDLHLHFTLHHTGDEGSYVQFQVDIVAAGVGGSMLEVYSGATGAIPIAPTPFVHQLLDLAQVPASNTTVSSIYKIRIERIASNADEYTGAFVVEFIDGHVQIDQPAGSREEYSK